MLVMKNISKMKEMMNTNTIKIPSIRGKILDKMSMELLMLILPQATDEATERTSKTNEPVDFIGLDVSREYLQGI